MSKQILGECEYDPAMMPEDGSITSGCSEDATAIMGWTDHEYDGLTVAFLCPRHIQHIASSADAYVVRGIPGEHTDEFPEGHGAACDFGSAHPMTTCAEQAREAVSK